MLPNDILQGRKVVILGFARQGQALARWLPTVGARVVVSDSRTETQLDINLETYPHVEFVLGEHPESLLDGATLLCVSGGVPLDLPIIQAAIARRVPISNDAQLFVSRCTAPVIGITGSAGKTTTTTLVGEMMRKAGYKTWVGGNIGNVLLDVLPIIQLTDRVVMELSSFQLELMTVSPPIGAILNITPNHLDRHGTMMNYARAKANIAAFQHRGDYVVLGRDDATTYALGELVPGQCVWFSMREIITDGAFMVGNRIAVAGASSPDGDPHIICERDEIPLRGDHNLLNVLAACAIAGVADIAPQAMREAILDFKAVPHRLEVVRMLNGVTYVNDSIATAPERTVAALRSYNEPLVLLLGGEDKDLPWEEVLLLALNKARKVVVFGKSGEKQVGDKIEKILKSMFGHADAITRVETLAEAVKLAQESAQAGDVVLLSPGGTSYDAYKDFAERGDHFRQLVSEL